MSPHLFKITLKDSLSAANATISSFFRKLLSDLILVSLSLKIFFAKTIVEDHRYS